MSNYIVSARKYRPDSFETLVGQDNIAKTLKNSILRGQLAHAYLFCGPRGVGKTSTARIFAKTINCLHPTAEMEPCGECESCKSFAEGRSYCIHELDAASNNGVDDIKALIDQVRIPPQVGKYSVYIIDEVHMLSPSAFNAFLKTLEEPPAYAIFILATTEKHKILPTILSRCQTYDFNRITVDNIVRNLKGIAANEEISIDEESLHVIAQKADGAMRDALTIFDQTVAFCGKDVKYQDVVKNLNVLDYEHSFRLVDAFLAGDYRGALLKFDEILSKGFNALHFVGALSSHIRNLIVSKNGGMDALLELPESLKEKFREQAGKCPLMFLYEALNITMQCESGYRASVNPRLHIEFCLMKLSFLREKMENRQQPSQPQQQLSQPQQQSQPQHHKAEPKEQASQPALEQPVMEQPVAVQEPVRARRRRNATGSSPLSLNSMIEQAGSNSSLQDTSNADVGRQASALPSDDIIKEKWPALADLYASKPRLASTLRSVPELHIEEKDGAKYITFSVMNEAQKDWIKSKLLHELEGRFQKIVNDSRILLRVDVIPEEEHKPVVYLPSEKAKELMSNNEQVRTLVSDFALDVK